METVLKATNIVKKFGDRTVLRGINMTIYKGDIYGFLGKNGAGKTTFMKTVLNLTSKDDGSIELFNHQSIEEAGLKVGSLIESPGLYKNASAYENLKRFSILYGANEAKINEILELVGLGNTGKRKAKDFSLGMKQRLGIAIALLGDPEFLILDEPINGLDPEGIKEIRDIIVKLNKERNVTFLISSHLLDELAKVVTRYGIINNGVIVEEIEANELRNKCKNKLEIEVDDPKLAESILLEMYSDLTISINNNTLELNSHIEDSANITKALVLNNVAVKAIYPNYDSLEEYFMRKIGD